MTNPRERGASGFAGALGLVALVVVGILVALAIGEIVARTIELPVAPDAHTTVTERTDLPVLQGPLDLGRPNAEGIHNGAYYRANSAGFRGPETESTPAPGVFRIAVVGDSVAMGSGVDNRSPYPALLPSVLRSRYPGREYEVLNFGMAGLNAGRIMARTQRYLRQFPSHLVVYGVTLNDLMGPRYERTALRGSARDEKREYIRYQKSPSHLLRLVWPRLVSMRDLFLPPPGSYVAELRYNYFENAGAWEDFENSLQSLANLCRAHESPLVVFQHTKLWYLNRFHPFRPMYRKIEESARRMGIPVISSLDALLGYDSQTLWVSWVDPHPNARGHQILAAALADGLAELPDGYFETGAAP